MTARDILLHCAQQPRRLHGAAERGDCCQPAAHVVRQARAPRVARLGNRVARCPPTHACAHLHGIVSRRERCAGRTAPACGRRVGDAALLFALPRRAGVRWCSCGTTARCIRTASRCRSSAPTCCGRRREALAALTPQPSWALGSVVLLRRRCCMTIAGRAGGIQVLEQLAFLVSLTARRAHAVRRRRTSASRWAALAYLLLMVPLWDGFTEPLHEPFQQRSAAIGIWLLHGIGIPAFREGTFITLPNLQIEVARVCSGVNYLVAVVALGLAARLRVSSRQLATRSSCSSSRCSSRRCRTACAWRSSARSRTTRSARRSTARSTCCTACSSPASATLCFCRPSRPDAANDRDAGGRAVRRARRSEGSRSSSSDPGVGGVDPRVSC